MTQWIESRAALSAYAQDYGNLVKDIPRAAVRPTTALDIQAAIRSARQHKIGIAPRGAGHSTGGQAQVAGGVILDMTSMSAVHELRQDSVWVDAGIYWRDLLTHTLRHGLTPPVFTDYIDLTVGGTLAVGGVGAQTFRHGCQTDNVLALDVVTGTGELVSCAPDKNADLFDLVRAGLGQFGIIARAQIKLVAAPQAVRFHRLFFGDRDSFLSMLNVLIDVDAFGGIEGFAIPNDETYITRLIEQFPDEITGTRTGDMLRAAPQSTWLYMIEIADYTPAPVYQRGAFDFVDLGLLPHGQFAWNLSYPDYIGRLTASMNMLRDLGIWALPHPWINVMVSSDDAPAFIGETLDETNPADAGAVLIYAYRRAALQTPLFRLPTPASAAAHVIKLAYLRTAQNVQHAHTQIEHNRRIWERVMACGGTRYPVDSVPMRAGDWAYQFGDRWSDVIAAKNKYDPDLILAPNQRIFR